MTHVRLSGRMLSVVLLSAAFVFVGCQQSSDSSDAAAEKDWTVLFDGQSLEGWHNPYDWGKAEVVDDEIHLKADKKFFLVTEDTYDDFVFEGEVRVPDRESNSGFMFRAQTDTSWVYGYQAEVDPSERAWSGGLYDEGRRGWLHPAEGDSVAGANFREEHGDAFNPDGWNKYRIRAVGDSLEISVNGEQTTAYRDTVDSEGVIGIQHHGEDGKVYRFRNLRIREVEAGM
ncbi:MAG: DUF1080 domain-containing protein [Salinibacter sp.]